MSNHKTTIWVDTDVAFDDDLVALACLFSPFSQCVIQGISTVEGMNTPQFGARAIEKLLFPPPLLAHPAATASAPRVFAGSNNKRRKQGENNRAADLPDWLAECRKRYQTFAQENGISPTQESHESSDESSERLKRMADHMTSNLEDCGGGESSSSSCWDAVVCLGPLTNFAHWISMCEDNPRLSNLIQRRVRHVYIMGGNRLIKNNKKAGFNFSSDPEAAFAVLSKLCATATKTTTMSVRIIPSGIQPTKEGELMAESQMDDMYEKLQNKFKKEKNQNNKNKSVFCNIVANFPRRFLVDALCAYACCNPQVVSFQRQLFHMDPETGLLMPRSEAANSNNAGNAAASHDKCAAAPHGSCRVDDKETTKKTTTTTQILLCAEFLVDYDFEHFLSWIEEMLQSQAASSAHQ